MARMNKRDQWLQEQAKLKAYGFKWRFAGIIEGEKGLPQKQWQLYTKDGEPISKVDALARIAKEEEFKINITDEEAEKMLTVGKALEYLRGKGIV